MPFLIHLFNFFNLFSANSTKMCYFYSGSEEIGNEVLAKQQYSSFARLALPEMCRAEAENFALVTLHCLSGVSDMAYKA